LKSPVEEVQRQEIAQLFAAVKRGDHREVEELILNSENKGVLVNAKNSNGRTPLHYAACFNHIKVVRILLAAKANTNARDNDNGRTPLHFAASREHTGIIEVLLAAGVDKNAKDYYGWTPLHSAIYNENTEVIKVLLAAGASRDVEDLHRRTPRDVTWWCGASEKKLLA
jgi:ankyrin repeat protein